METVLSNKTFVLVTERGYYYTPDRERKTTSKKQLAEWLGKDEKDIIAIGVSSYYYTGFLLEPMKGENRVRLSYWKIKNARINKEGFEVSQIKRKGDEDGSKSVMYLYPDGSVSHDDAYEEAEREKNKTPHRIKKNPEMSYSEWYDIPYNMTDMGRQEIWEKKSSLSDWSKEVLKGANFPEFYNIRSYKMQMRNFDNLITYIKLPVGRKSNKSVQELEKKIEPIKDDEIIKVEKDSLGTLIRMKSGESGKEGVEDTRVFIDKTGTISQNFLYTKYDGEKGVEVWNSRNAKDTRWFYKICYENRDVIRRECVNLVDGNPKFKYLNEYINKHLDDLFILSHKAEWGENGIIEFLRLANKYPVVVDYLSKIEIADEIFFYKNGCSINEKGEKVYFANWLNDAGEKVKGKEIKYLTFDKDALESFGKIEKEKDFFGAMGINRGQWKFLLGNATEKTAKRIVESLCSLESLKEFFCGHKAKEKKNYWYWGEPRYEWKYKLLSEVPMNEFERVYKIWQKYAYDKTLHNSYVRSDGEYFSVDGFIEEYKDELDYGRRGIINEGKVLGDVEEDTIYRTIETCCKRNIRVTLLRDYRRMKHDCREIEGFDADAWVDIPRNAEELKLFHDRLVDIYNENQNEKRAKEEASRNEMYKKQLKALSKFEYEEDEDTRCIVLPRDLMEIVQEGQRLHHCVGSYTTSVAEGRETILFLRDKNSKGESYATVDVTFDKENKVWRMRQVHTAYNGKVTEEDNNFLLRWAAKNNVDEKSVREASGHVCCALR